MSTRTRQAIEGTVSLALVALLVWWVDLGTVGRLYRDADLRFLAAGLLVAGADRIIMVVKWRPLVRVQGVPVPLGRALRVYLASNFASLFLPSSVGGDMVRALAIGRPHGAVMEVAASIAMERVLGILGIGVLLGISLPLVFVATPGLEPYAVLTAGAMGAILLLAVLPLVPAVARRVEPLGRWLQGRRLGRPLATLAGAYGRYRGHLRVVSLVGLASTAEQLVPFILYGLTALALGISVEPVPLLVAVLFSQILGRLPLSLNGVGVEEGAAILFLGLFGLPPAQALSLALGRRILESSAYLPGALFWKDLSSVLDSGDPRGEERSPVPAEGRGP